MPTVEQRLEQTERDLRDHSKSITSLVEDQRDLRGLLIGLEQDKAVRAVEDKHLDDRLDRIEERLKAVYSLGLWLLAAAGASLVAVAVEFVVNGGLRHVT